MMRKRGIINEDIGRKKARTRTRTRTRGKKTKQD